MSINRDDPCICGSGQKYKKCCMKDNVVSLDGIRDSELNSLQLELITFATHHYEDVLNELLDELLDNENLGEDEDDIVSFFLTVWIIFLNQMDTEQSIFKQFVQMKKKENTLRPSTLNQLEAWDQTTASFSIVTNIIDDFHLEVEDVLTNEKMNVTLIDKHDGLEEGGALLGFLLPYGNHYSYLTMFLDFPADKAPAMISELIEAYQESELSDAKDFIMNTFPGLILALFIGDLEGPDIDIDEIEWDDPTYKEVASLYIKQIEEEGNPDEMKVVGVGLWYAFCQKEKPTIRKPQIYASALHYLVDRDIMSYCFYTQAEIAEIYNVSKGSYVKAYRQLEIGLEDEIEDMFEFLEEDEDDDYPFSPDYDDDDEEDDDDDDPADEDEFDFGDLFSNDKESPFYKKRK